MAPTQQPRKKAFNLPKPGAGAYTGHVDRVKQALVHKAGVKKRYARDLRDTETTSTSDFLARGTAAAEIERTDASTSAAPVEPAFVPRPKRKKGVEATGANAVASGMHPDRAKRLGLEAPPVQRKTAAERYAEERERDEAERVAWNKRTARGAPDIASRMNVLLCAWLLAIDRLDPINAARIERTIESEKAEQPKRAGRR